MLLNLTLNDVLQKHTLSITCLKSHHAICISTFWNLTPDPQWPFQPLSTAVIAPLHVTLNVFCVHKCQLKQAIYLYYAIDSFRLINARSINIFGNGTLKFRFLPDHCGVHGWLNINQSTGFLYRTLDSTQLSYMCRTQAQEYKHDAYIFMVVIICLASTFPLVWKHANQSRDSCRHSYVKQDSTCPAFPDQ